MQIQPYLFFDGRCEEALDFYRDAVGAEVTFMMRFKDGPPGAGCADGSVPDPEKIMHASVKLGDSTFMVSDGMNKGQPNFAGFSLSITADDDAAAERLFKRLGEGGQVQAPLSKTFFASTFGMVADKFGVSWMVLAGA